MKTHTHTHTHIQRGTSQLEMICNLHDRAVANSNESPLFAIAAAAEREKSLSWQRTGVNITYARGKEYTSSHNRSDIICLSKVPTMFDVVPSVKNRQRRRFHLSRVVAFAVCRFWSFDTIALIVIILWTERLHLCERSD